jgi:hypothetical protein
MCVDSGAGIRRALRGGQEELTMTIRTTLLDLVATVSEFAETEDELLAVVVHLVNSGRATLIGTFKGARFDLDTVAAAA